MQAHASHQPPSPMHDDDDDNGEWLAHTMDGKKVSGGPPSPTPLSPNDPSMRVVSPQFVPKQPVAEHAIKLDVRPR